MRKRKGNERKSSTFQHNNNLLNKFYGLYHWTYLLRSKNRILAQVPDPTNLVTWTPFHHIKKEKEKKKQKTHNSDNFSLSLPLCPLPRKYSRLSNFWPRFRRSRWKKKSKQLSLPKPWKDNHIYKLRKRKEIFKKMSAFHFSCFV